MADQLWLMTPIREEEGGYSPLPLSLGFWLVRGSALGPICSLSGRQLKFYFAADFYKILQHCKVCSFAHTFYFNNKCQTVSEQQLIFLKFNLPLSVIKSESDRKWVCKSDRCRLVKKRRHPIDSKADSKSVTFLIGRCPFVCLYICLSHASNCQNC